MGMESFSQMMWSEDGCDTGGRSSISFLLSASICLFAASISSCAFVIGGKSWELGAFAPWLGSSKPRSYIYTIGGGSTNLSKSSYFLMSIEL